MIILELDYGNTLIKWRIIKNNTNYSIFNGIINSVHLLINKIFPYRLIIDACRLVSVRSKKDTEYLILKLRTIFSFKIINVAVSSEELAGVKNGYINYKNLGPDRWLAIVGGYHIYKKACVIIDLGTTLTSDFVNKNGCHLGGYICPGIPFMIKQIFDNINIQNISYNNPILSYKNKNLSPGKTTLEAVQYGCILAIKSFIKEQYMLAYNLFGKKYQIIITGGDANIIKHELPKQSRIVPELVFIGLGLACPIPEEGFPSG